jgi:RimJ/RimL family protein N-acetyltransferase
MIYKRSKKMNLILQTNRLILRPLQLSDAKSFFEMDSNPNVHRYLWNKPTQDINETITTIKFVQQQYIDHNIGRFAIILKENNQFIGWAGLKFNTETVNNKTNFYDIGYRLNETFWKKGYATEASFAWQKHAFQTMKIKRISAAAHTDNVPSNKILQKIGMTMTEKYLEDNISWNWYDMENKI